MKKITDKIYIAESNSYPGFFAQEYFQLHKQGRLNSIEYIRKDALLEWAKEQQRKWEECINTSKKFPELKKSFATYSGAKIQTEELIDKLNSM